MAAEKLACENETDVSHMIALLFETMTPQLFYFLSPQQHCCRMYSKHLGRKEVEWWECTPVLYHSHKLRKPGHNNGLHSSTSPSFSFVPVHSLICIWFTRSLFVALFHLKFYIVSLLTLSIPTLSLHLFVTCLFLHLSLTSHYASLSFSLYLSVSPLFFSLSLHCRCLTVTLSSHGCCSILIWLFCSGTDTHMLLPFSWLHFTLYSLFFLSSYTGLLPCSNTFCFF